MRTEAILAAIAVGTLAAPARCLAWCQSTTDLRDLRPGETCIFAEPPRTFPLAWRQRCTAISFSSVRHSFTLSDEQLQEVFESAIATWESVECDEGGSPNFRIELLGERDQCSAAVHYLNGPNTNGITFIDDAEEWSIRHEESIDAFAVTLVYFDPANGEIWGADIEFNEPNGPYRVCPPEGCTEGEVDVLNVLTHEMGHYLGLSHSTDPDATMFASAEPSETIKRDLAFDDAEGLCAIYPSGSLADRCDPTPRGGLGLDCRPRCACTAPGAGRRAAPISALGVALVSLLAYGLRRRRL